MTNEERILRYLGRISPQPATNAEIGRYAEVKPHQQVFQITHRLLTRGTIRGARDAHEWRFFDMISEDCTVVGDAKYFSLVRGTSSPPAKFSVIAEHVWLLEKTGAIHRFLVFGNERQVPTRWLKRYGELSGTVEFFFLRPDAQLEKLA